jgi:hypothetical protein
MTYSNYFSHQYPYSHTSQDKEYRVARRVELGRGLSETPVDLGNGFFKFKWMNQQIGSNETVTYFLNAEGMNVISAGYLLGREDIAFAMESYPRSTEQWVITVINPSPQREIQLFLIAKLK